MAPLWLMKPLEYADDWLLQLHTDSRTPGFISSFSCPVQQPKFTFSTD